MILIAIEGSDGVGKATQTKMLCQALQAQGTPTLAVEFPAYATNVFGGLLAECLAGKRGNFVHMDAKVASMLYSLDRYESSPAIRKALAGGTVVVSDRFSGSNQIHQGGKIEDESKRAEFLSWLDHAEHTILGNPRPDAVIYLKMPLSVSLELLAKKRTAKNAQFADGDLDQVEQDKEYLRRSHQMANWLAVRDARWFVIDCANADGSVRTREDIHQEIFNYVSTLV